MKILLIDDDQEISNLIKIELEDDNHKVDLAYDGLSGKKLATEEKYDVIILDTMLPGINGYEVCKKIRYLVDSPILMITALDKIEDRVLSFSCGADDFLPKPFLFHDLMNRIKILQTMKVAN